MAALGLRSSRFGPTLPFVPAARERVAAAAVGGREDRLAVGRRRAAVDRGGRRACRPSPRSASAPTSSTSTVKAAATQVTGARMRSIASAARQGEGKPFFEMNHSPLVSHTAIRIVNSTPPAIGSAMPGSARERTTIDLGRERAVERAAEQRVEQDARRRVLERELVEAVVGDRQAEQEREPPGDPVQRRRSTPARRRAAAGRTSTRRQDLHDGEEHGDARQPHLHRDRVAEAERDRRGRSPGRGRCRRSRASARRARRRRRPAAAASSLRAAAVRRRPPSRTSLSEPPPEGKGARPRQVGGSALPCTGAAVMSPARLKGGGPGREILGDRGIEGSTHVTRLASLAYSDSTPSRRPRRSTKGQISDAISSDRARARGRCGSRDLGGPGSAADTPLSGAALHQPRLVVRRPLRQPAAASTSATTSRRWSSSRSVRGSGNDITYTMTLPTDPNRSPTQQRRPRHDLELPAPPDVLVRADAVRHASPRPSSRRHCTPDSDANDLVGTNPAARRLHRQAPRQRLHGAAVLRARLRPAVRGLRLHRAPVLRGDDDRQPDARPEHRHRRTPPPATTTSSAAPSRSTGPTSPGTVTRRRRRTRCSPGPSTAPNFSAVNPDLTKDLLMSPGDRIRIHMHDTTAGLPDRPRST